MDFKRLMFGNASTVFVENPIWLYDFMFVGMHLVFKQNKTFNIASAKPCGSC